MSSYNAEPQTSQDSPQPQQIMGYKSEYKDKFVPLEASAPAHFRPPNYTSPNAVDIDALNPSKWKSEHKTVFKPLVLGHEPTAGVQSTSSLISPMNFAWKQPAMASEENGST